MQGLERAHKVLEERLTPVNKGGVHRPDTCCVLPFSYPQLQLHDVAGIEKDKAEHIGALPPPSFARNCGLSGVFFEQAGR